MIEIRAERKGNSYLMEIKGHAETRVCAGISALACTLSGAIKANPSVHRAKSRLDPGDTRISFQARNRDAKEDFYFSLLGMLMIENSYPDQVSVSQNFFNVHANGGDL